jgi:hypothetical protein
MNDLEDLVVMGAAAGLCCINGLCCRLQGGDKRRMFGT